MKYFSVEEFDCPCCGENEMEPEFLLALDRARGSAATPFIITSGYRCQDYNDVVGGKPDSAHTKGLAADIAVHSSHTRFLIKRALYEHGFRRLGDNQKQKFIHVDVDDSKPMFVEWSY